MPVYEYFCRTCNTRFDKLRPVRDADEPADCPTCSQQNNVRALSVFIVQGSSRNAGYDTGYESGASSSQFSGGCACGGNCGCASKN